ncbi:hypothetical protein CAX48_09565 [Listeria monocytogenes]|nr:hypothetical protein [Listeria monocytogenes]EAG8560687.1 hypothetical protein [Listeria monocytogenes]EBI2479845.1 hypothetical protein [Listeria monocytogenes]EEP6660211.1 hypothetical protein [Listeria monocytogenes]
MVKTGYFKVNGKYSFVEYYEEVFLEEIFKYMQQSRLALHRLKEIKRIAELLSWHDNDKSQKYLRETKKLETRMKELEKFWGIEDEISEKSFDDGTTIEVLDVIEEMVESIYKYLVLKQDAEKLTIEWLDELISSTMGILSSLQKKIGRTAEIGKHALKINEIQRTFKILQPAVSPKIFYHIKTNDAQMKKALSSLSKKKCQYLYFGLIDFSDVVDQMYNRLEGYEKLIYTASDDLLKYESFDEEKKRNKIIFGLTIVATIATILQVWDFVLGILT